MRTDFKLDFVADNAVGISKSHDPECNIKTETDVVLC